MLHRCLCNQLTLPSQFSDDEDEDDDDDDDAQKTTEKGAENSDAEDDAMDEDNEEDDKGENDEHVNKKADDRPKSNSSSLPKLADASLDQYGIESIKSDISVLEKERDSIAKNANMGAIAEFRKKEADYLSR